MNALTGIWLSSLIGTVLFIAAGFLAGLIYSRRQPLTAGEGIQPQLPAAGGGKAARELATLREQLAAAQASESKRAQEAASLRQEKTALSTEVSKLEKQSLDLKSQVAKAIEDRDQAIKLRAVREEEEEEKTLVQGDPRPSSEEYFSLQEKLAAMEQELKQARTTFDRVQKENASLQARVADVQKQGQQTQADLQKQVQQSQAQKVSLQSQLADLQKRLQQAENAGKRPAAAAPAAPGAPSEEVQALQELIEARKHELEQSLKTESELRNKVVKLEADLKDLRSSQGKLETAQQAQDALKREVQELKGRIAASDNKLGQVDRLEEDRTKLKLQLDELREELEHTKGLEKVADEKHELVMKLEALKQKEQEVEQLRDERVRLQDQLKESQQKLDQLKNLEHVAKERHDLAIKVEVLSKQLEELERLREDKLKLSDQLKEAEHRAGQVKDLESASKDRQDLAIKVDMLNTQLEELNRLREENTRLRSSSGEIIDLRKSLEELQTENASLRSMGLVREKPVKIEQPQAPLEGFGGSLQKMLSQLAEKTDARGAVLADEMGLLVAGVGNHTEALAALAALMSDTGSRAKVLLPFAALDKLIMADENSLTVTAQPLQTDMGHLILATLTVGPGLERKDMQHLLQSIPGSLA